MNMTISQMRAALANPRLDPPVPPCHWGNTRHHIFYGALYHWFVMCLNVSFPRFRPHRSLTVRQEFLLHLKRLTLMPFHGMERRWATRRLKQGGFPYHVALLQLAHDASFQDHGPFKAQKEFIHTVIVAFAQGAPQHHHLVFKAHPLEDGRTPLKSLIRTLSRLHGISQRVHFLRGGKLAPLLDEARTAITVNSTAGQQALWRGLALRALGRAVYNKPELVSDQPLAEFFANPTIPDYDAYRDYRDFLLRTSQCPGGFYSRRGRQQSVRHLVDMMLASASPYAKIAPESASRAQHLRVVDG